jgi:ribonuclease P protein component
VLQARRRSDEGPVRVGFTVSKQVGNAVERNRVRRRLREIVKLTADGQLYGGHDYVLIGRRPALEAPFGEMRRELDAALSRIHAAERGGTGGVPLRNLHETGSSAAPRRKPSPKPK